MAVKWPPSESKAICVWILVISLVGVNLGDAKKVKEVTCGSVIKLMNTAYKVRLHSHDINYGSGSGQQSVTGTDVKEDVNSHWIVKGTGKNPCKRGELIECGEKIRLQHMSTNKNLHSHWFSSPLSGKQEISAFGEGGIGDSGDDWEIICKGKNWLRDDAIQLRHADTDMFLSSSGHTFGRPISGQMEIVGVSSSDSSSYWRAMEGVFVHPNDSGDSKEPFHNEL